MIITKADLDAAVAAVRADMGREISKADREISKAEARAEERVVRRLLNGLAAVAKSKQIPSYAGTSRSHVTISLADLELLLKGTGDSR